MRTCSCGETVRSVVAGTRPNGRPYISVRCPHCIRLKRPGRDRQGNPIAGERILGTLDTGTGEFWEA